MKVSFPSSISDGFYSKTAQGYVCHQAAIQMDENMDITLSPTIGEMTP